MGRKQTELGTETSGPAGPRRSSRRKRANDEETQPKVNVTPEEKKTITKIAESVKPEKVRTQKKRTGSGSIKIESESEVGARPLKKRKINVVDLPPAEYSVTYGNKTIKFTELNFGTFKIKATKPQI